MKRILGLTAVIAAGLGIWAGVSAWPSPGAGTTILAGGAILIGANLLFCLWLWRRAQPGSGDALVLPTVIVLSASMLLGILPRLFWPAAEGLQVASSIANMLIVTALLAVQIRRLRRLRRGRTS
jgi:FtsH-binding integral membrane protein